MKFFTKTAPPGGDTIGFEPTAYDIRVCTRLRSVLPCAPCCPVLRLTFVSPCAAQALCVQLT
eukprot:2377924-Prymnesium_polylepis.1